MSADWLPFGMLGRPHGTRGEIHVRSYSGGPAERLVVPSPVRVTGAGVERALVLASVRAVPDGYLARFDGLPDREAVAGLCGLELQFPRVSLPELAADEFYVEDIVGCDAVLADGARLGKVAGTFWNGAHDVMTVVAEDGGERLLPVVPAYVLRFDRERRQVVVDPHD